MALMNAAAETRAMREKLSRAALEAAVTELATVREALEGMICAGCGNRVGWTGAYEGINRQEGRYDWRKCGACKRARAALGQGGDQSTGALEACQNALAAWGKGS